VRQWRAPRGKEITPRSRYVRPPVSSFQRALDELTISIASRLLEYLKVGTKDARPRGWQSIGRRSEVSRRSRWRGCGEATSEKARGGDATSGGAGKTERDEALVAVVVVLP
jgi:hypothetical protein